MKRLAVVTSGGDASGMNAAIAAVARTGLGSGAEVFGVLNGYRGLIDGDLRPFDSHAVSEVMHVGGTILGTSRAPEFHDPTVQAKARDALVGVGVDGLVVIGGNGSQKGSFALSQLGFPVVGVASTIDNDLYGSDISIGADTALNVIVEAMDRVRMTAAAHHRAFLIEVGGRDHGYLALTGGVASGAEVVVTPEFEMEPAEIADRLRQAHEAGKKHACVVVTDGARNNAAVVQRYFEERETEIGFELRVTVLGYVQRGGPPGCFDRLLATRLGTAAARLLIGGGGGQLVGWSRGSVCCTPLEEVARNTRRLDEELVALGGGLTSRRVRRPQCAR